MDTFLLLRWRHFRIYLLSAAVFQKGSHHANERQRGTQRIARRNSDIGILITKAKVSCFIGLAGEAFYLSDSHTTCISPPSITIDNNNEQILDHHIIATFVDSHC